MPTEQQQILAYQRAVRMIRDRVITFATTTWVGLGAYRDADIDRLIRLVVPQVLAGERQVAQLTDAYLSTLAGTPRAGVDRDTVSGAALRGVDPTEVYRRPGVTVWTELSNGLAPQQAIEAGMRRLVSLIDTDLQLARRWQERETLGTGGFKYARRTLTGRENCGLCVIASTQRYRVTDLRPIHPGCDCGTAHFREGSDPGQVLNEDLLEAMHEQIGMRFGDDDRGARILQDLDGNAVEYKDILIREHGELGPVLTWRKQRFTGPADLAP